MKDISMRHAYPMLSHINAILHTNGISPSIGQVIATVLLLKWAILYEVILFWSWVTYNPLKFSNFELVFNSIDPFCYCLNSHNLWGNNILILIDLHKTPSHLKLSNLTLTLCHMGLPEWHTHEVAELHIKSKMLVNTYEGISYTLL